MIAAWQRYALFQTPGWALALLAALGLWQGGWLDGRAALVAWTAWVLKDLVMYPIVKDAYQGGACDGAARYVGATGTCVTEVSSTGQIRIAGELWRARANAGETLARGQKAVVIAAEGMTLVVRSPARREGAGRETNHGEEGDSASAAGFPAR
jgi:membrane protein implicated in regulation of membrane protease activity